MSENNQNDTQTTEEQGSGLEGVDFAPGRAKKAGAGPGGVKTDENAGSQADDERTAEQTEGQPEAGESELDAARREIAELKDNWSRERAEFSNFRKRQMQERAKARAHAIGDFVQKLLPAFDNLDRVLSADTEDPAVKNFVIGVDMIRQEMLQALEGERIKAISPAGEAFDPFAMEAIAMEDRDDLSSEIVLEVFQPGYVLEGDENERHVLRPARVKVGKPARKGEEARTGGD